MALPLVWIDVADQAELERAEVLAVEAGPHPICLYAVGAEVFATHAICTHGFAHLGAGYLEEHEIECPLHQGRFDVRDGRATLSPCVEPIRTFPARVERGRVLIGLPEEEAPL